jgi:hypothetical protein
MLTDAEVLEMGAIAREQHLEVCLFVTPRANYDTGGAVKSSGAVGWRNRGMDELAYCVDDILRACELGIRGILVADLGLLKIVGQLKQMGHLPADLAVKVSALLAAANPVDIHLMQELGATTVNVLGDLSAAQLATIRQVCELPLDLYIEAPDGLGGFVRFFECARLVRVAAPLYVKLGVSNAAGIYPSGSHLEAAAIAQGRERVRRARLVLEQMQRDAPELVQSPLRSPDLAVPVDMS